MTLQEAYDKAMEIGGTASVDKGMQTYDSGILPSFSVRAGVLWAHNSVSFEECFAEIARQDPEAKKAELIAEKEAELAELRS